MRDVLAVEHARFVGPGNWNKLERWRSTPFRSFFSAPLFLLHFFYFTE